MPDKQRVEHTELPWKVAMGQWANAGHVFVDAENNGMFKPYICEVRSINADGLTNTDANARYIVLSANFHERLVDELRRTLQLCKELMPPDDPHVCHSWQIQQAESLLAEIAKEEK